ncbi:MAG: hypothetical protein WA231_25030 [Methylocella sp.]
MRLIDQRRGEVLWIDGPAEAWFILGRPQWASPLQGNPTIFSSALAAEWRNRMQVLMDLRLADQKSFAARTTPLSADPPRLSQEGVRRLCAREDAPAWIIAPLERQGNPSRNCNETMAIARAAIPIDQGRRQLHLAKNRRLWGDRLRRAITSANAETKLTLPPRKP